MREEAFFYRLDSAFKLAINSREAKRTVDGIVPLKKNRLKTAKEYYISFKKLYVNSKHIEAANIMGVTINEELKNYSTKS